MLRLQTNKGTKLFYNVMPAISGKAEVMVHKNNETEAKAWLSNSISHIANTIDSTMYHTVFMVTDKLQPLLNNATLRLAPGIPTFINLHPLPSATATSSNTTTLNSYAPPPSFSNAPPPRNAWLNRKSQRLPTADTQNTIVNNNQTPKDIHTQHDKSDLVTDDTSTVATTINTEAMDRIATIEENFSRLQKLTNLHEATLLRQQERIKEMEEIHRSMNSVTQINDRLDSLTTEVKHLRKASLATNTEIELGHQATASIAKAIKQHQTTLTQVIHDQTQFQNTASADIANLFQSTKRHHET
jgi:hypothetical protein